MGNSLDGIPSLRPDEILLLELLSAGHSNKELAYRLGVSESAVKKRIGRLMRRLSTTSRVEFVRAAFARGVVHRRR